MSVAHSVPLRTNSDCVFMCQDWTAAYLHKDTNKPAFEHLVNQEDVKYRAQGIYCSTSYFWFDFTSGFSLVNG